MAGFNVSPAVAGLSQIVAGLRDIRSEADSTRSTLDGVRQSARDAESAVSAASKAAEEDTGRVKKALEDTARVADESGGKAKDVVAGLLDDVEVAGRATSEFLARFDAIQEQVPPQLRAYIDLSEGWVRVLERARGELNTLRDQVRSGALDVQEILDRLGELQTDYAQRIIEAMRRLKDGGDQALRELNRLISEARRIPDSATGILAGALGDALKNGHL